jgi:hypothetical protein
MKAIAVRQQSRKAIMAGEQRKPDWVTGCHFMSVFNKSPHTLEAEGIVATAINSHGPIFKSNPFK